MVESVPGDKLSSESKAKIEEIGQISGCASVMDERVLLFLEALRNQSALAALDEFIACMKYQQHSIKNKAAYLMGVLKKYHRKDKEYELYGTEDNGEKGLGDTAARLIERLKTVGIGEDIIDDRCRAFISNLGDAYAVAALEEFYNYLKVPGKMEQIRNKRAFLMGVLKKYFKKKQEKERNRHDNRDRNMEGNGRGARDDRDDRSRGSRLKLLRDIRDAMDGSSASASANGGRHDRSFRDHRGYDRNGPGRDWRNDNDYRRHRDNDYRRHDNNFRPRDRHRDYNNFNDRPPQRGVPSHPPPPPNNNKDMMQVPHPQTGELMWVKVLGKSGPDQGKTFNNAGSSVMPEVQNAIDGLVAKGLINHSDLDQRVMDFIVKLPVSIALQALDDFAISGSKARNKSAYIMGIMKKAYRPVSEQRQGQGRGGRDAYIHSQKRPRDHGGRRPEYGGYDNRQDPYKRPRNMHTQNQVANTPSWPAAHSVAAPAPPRQPVSQHTLPLGPPPQHGIPRGPPPPTSGLTKLVKDSLEWMYNVNICQREDIEGDARIMGMLRNASEDQAVSAIKEFSYRPDRAQAPSLGNMFAGSLSKFMFQNPGTPNLQPWVGLAAVGEAAVNANAQHQYPARSQVGFAAQQSAYHYQAQ